MAGFNTRSSSDDLEEMLLFFKEIVTTHSIYHNILIECVNDIFDYKVDGLSFQDIILEIFDLDEGIYQHYLSELQKIVGEYVRYNNTPTVKSIIVSQRCTLPILLPLSRNGYSFWSELDDFEHTCNLRNTLKISSNYIANNYKNESEFIKLCKINYIFLDFHDDIESTLRTIKIGKYYDYINLITHSLNVLNQSYFLVSTDANKNQEDLNVIMNLSNDLGERLECSRQGKNKVEWEFKNISISHLNERETINCEYHLKINKMDDGRDIPLGDGNPIRIYFGLKSYPELDRKQFKVAHIGKHL